MRELSLRIRYLDGPDTARKAREAVGAAQGLAQAFLNREPTETLVIEPRAAVTDEDLRRVEQLVEDLAFYRTVEDDGGLGGAAWIELRDAVGRLPEGPQ